MTDDQRQAVIDFAKRIHSEMTATLIDVKQAFETLKNAGDREVRAVRQMQRNLQEMADLTAVLRDDGEPK